MDTENILRHCDHTLLKPDATFGDIKVILDEAKNYGTASACIPPCYVRDAKEYAGDSVRITTVIGFPHGNETTATKVFQAEEAVRDGADEIDMVINIGRLRAGDDDYVRSEIEQVRKVTGGHILKVIVENCYLTRDEKIRACHIVTEAGADYIKTSTGFGTGGATFDDVELMARNVGEGVKIKAAGGIHSLEDAEHFLNLGADRLGTSRIVKIVEEMEGRGQSGR